MKRKQEILQKLDNIEKDHDVSILYACESGSRAWGFASQDSDFDVRFIYIHPPEWYLSIDFELKRDVIELPIDDLLDINGWDLRKALGLLRKSNPPLIEWIGSPIVYKDKQKFSDGFRKLLPKSFSPVLCAYHYLSMAKRTYKEHLQKEQVRLKKYFYVLRPLLAVQWIENDYGVVPTEFYKLVEKLVDDKELLSAIHDLLERKQSGTEKDTYEKITVLNEFIESELNRLEGTKFAQKGSESKVEDLNGYFRGILNSTWV